MENNITKLKYARVTERMKDLKTFYIMISGYVLLVPLLVFLNLKTTTDYRWFWFPVIGAGSGILSQAVFLFAGKKWEQKKIKKLMEKENNNNYGQY